MTLLDDMVHGVTDVLVHGTRLSKCEHLDSKLDFWCPILDTSTCSPPLQCAVCAARFTTVDRCAHCGELLIDRGVRALWCVLTFERYGASHLQDHFYALLCETCGAHVPESTTDVVPPARLISTKRGTIFLVYRKFTKWLPLTGAGPPMTTHTERQREHLAAQVAEASD